MNRRNFLKGFLATATVVALAPLVPIAIPVEPRQVLNFDALVATTLKNYRKALADNITTKQPIWYKMKELGWIVPEGQAIVEPTIFK